MHLFKQNFTFFKEALSVECNNVICKNKKNLKIKAIYSTTVELASDINYI